MTTHVLSAHTLLKWLCTYVQLQRQKFKFNGPEFVFFYLLCFCCCCGVAVPEHTESSSCQPQSADLKRAPPLSNPAPSAMPAGPETANARHISAGSKCWKFSAVPRPWPPSWELKCSSRPSTEGSKTQRGLKYSAPKRTSQVLPLPCSSYYLPPLLCIALNITFLGH